MPTCGLARRRTNLIQTAAWRLAIRVREHRKIEAGTRVLIS
jgi:hypothetical protein